MRDCAVQQLNYEKTQEAGNPTSALSKRPTGKAEDTEQMGRSTRGLSLISQIKGSRGGSERKQQPTEKWAEGGGVLPGRGIQWLQPQGSAN